MTAVEIDLQLRYSDFDMNRHLNNAACVGLFEAARVHLSSVPIGGETTTTLSAALGPDAALYVTDQYIEYQQPAVFRVEPVRVRVGVTRIGRTSFDYSYELLDCATDDRYAIAYTGMALVDADGGRPMPLPVGYRQMLESFRRDPLSFRRQS